MHWAKHLWSGGLGCLSSVVAAGDPYSASEEWGWSSHREFALWALLTLKQKDSKAKDFFVQLPFRNCNFLEKHLYFSIKIQNVSFWNYFTVEPARQRVLAWLAARLSVKLNHLSQAVSFSVPAWLLRCSPCLCENDFWMGTCSFTCDLLCSGLCTFFFSLLPYCLILCLCPSRSMRFPKLLLRQAALWIVTPFKGETVP